MTDRKCIECAIKRTKYTSWEEFEEHLRGYETVSAMQICARFAKVKHVYGLENDVICL